MISNTDISEKLQQYEQVVGVLEANGFEVDAEVEAYLQDYLSHAKHEMLAIYDVKRFIEVLEKSTKNPSARTVAGLEKLQEKASFVAVA